MMALDMQRLDAFMGRFIGDLGATLHAGMVVIGERLGLYKALAEGPQTSAELAANTGTDERYVREWLSSQAAGGYVEYDPVSKRFSLSEEQAFALATEGSPAYIPGAFELATAALKAVPKLVDAFRTGAGMGWHEHDPDAVQPRLRSSSLNPPYFISSTRSPLARRAAARASMKRWNSGCVR